MAGFGQQNMPALPLEQRPFQSLFQGVDTLADGRLGKPQHAGSASETAQFGSPGKRFQMRQLIGAHRVYRSTDLQSVHRSTVGLPNRPTEKNTAAAIKSLRRVECLSHSFTSH